MRVVCGYALCWVVPRWLLTPMERSVLRHRHGVCRGGQLSAEQRACIPRKCAEAVAKRKSKAAAVATSTAPPPPSAAAPATAEPAKSQLSAEQQDCIARMRALCVLSDTN